MIKYFEILSIFLFCVGRGNTFEQPRERMLTINLNDIEKQKNQVKPERKTMFTPYMNQFEDYSAKHVGDGDSNEGQAYMAAGPVGQEQKNTSSIIPGGFSGGYTIPGTNMYPMSHLGLTSPIHPMTTGTYNPFNIGLQPSMASSNLQNSALSTTNQFSVLGQSPLSSINQRSPLMNTMASNMSVGGIRGAREGSSDKSLFSSIHVPSIHVPEQCDSVKKQAISIANEVLLKQYKVIFKSINQYLSTSKYLIGMTEIKMTKKLRRHLTQIMGMFQNLTPQQILFSDASVHSLTDKDFEKLLNSELDFSEALKYPEPQIDEFVHKI